MKPPFYLFLSGDALKDNLTSLWALLLILAGSVCLTGCGTIEESKQSQQMEVRLHLYSKTARWGALENLYGFLTPEESVKIVFPDNLDNIRVTGYQVRIPPMMLDEHKLSQTVTIEYLLRDTQVIKVLSDDQVWEYNQETKEWFRANPIPEFK
jgi:hypothetical protein